MVSNYRSKWRWICSGIIQSLMGRWHQRTICRACGPNGYILKSFAHSYECYWWLDSWSRLYIQVQSEKYLWMGSTQRRVYLPCSGYSFDSWSSKNNNRKSVHQDKLELAEWLKCSNYRVWYIDQISRRSLQWGWRSVLPRQWFSCCAKSLLSHPCRKCFKTTAVQLVIWRPYSC